MARRDDETAAERRRRREQEDEEERAADALKRAKNPGRPGLPGSAPLPPPASASSEELLARATPLVDQVNALYRQYSLGLERLPPNQLRQQLEQILEQLQKSPKATHSEQYRANSLRASYLTYREKWDKLLRDVETGRITIRPKK